MPPSPFRTAPTDHGIDVTDLSTEDIRLPVHPTATATVPRRADQPYRPATGDARLRALVAEHTSYAGGATIHPDQVIVTPGARQAILVALHATLPTRREVLLPTPYWSSYPQLIRLAGGIPVRVPGEPGDATLDLAVLDRRRTPATGAIVINSPRNPDGAVTPAPALRAILDWADRHGLYVLFDQVYRGVPLGTEPAPSITQLHPELPEHCVLVDGLTKSHALAGLRLGWAVVNGQLRDTMTKIAAHLIGGTSGPVQDIGAYVLSNGRDTTSRLGAALAANLDTALAGLADVPTLTCPRPAGGIFLLLDLRAWLASRYAPADARDDLVRWLREQHRVSVADGAAYGAPGWVRISFAVPDETLREGVRRIRYALLGAAA